MGFQKKTTRGRPSTFDAGTIAAATKTLSGWRKSATVGDEEGGYYVFSENDATAALALGGEDDTFRKVMVSALDGTAADVERVKTVRSRITRALDVENVEVIYGIADDGKPSFGLAAVNPRKVKTPATKTAAKKSTKKTTATKKSAAKK